MGHFSRIKIAHWYNEPALIRRLFAGCATLLALIITPPVAEAQAPPPRIGPWVLDLHGTWVRFPQKEQLAASRGLDLTELPHNGLGLHGGVHVYPLSWKAVTFGFGVDAAIARAHRGSALIDATTGQMSRAVTANFSHAAPEISFNFGTGNGWSYISGGIGPGVWSVVPDGASSQPPDLERLQTINYGGGARWFNLRHVAFSLDVRFYAIEPSTQVSGSSYPTSPRSRMLVIGAGLSFK